MNRTRLQFQNPPPLGRAYSRPLRRSGSGPIRVASRVVGRRSVLGIQLQSSQDLADWTVEGEWQAAEGTATFAEVRPAGPWVRACAWPEGGAMAFDLELLER
ncbi:MAG: hypothetical protein IT452_15910, partial [Planctomycetia bacterium]|nr:hypothetical protein [Planctomycetia bacterium]